MTKYQHGETNVLYKSASKQKIMQKRRRSLCRCDGCHIGNHYGDLKDRYRQRRDRTRQLVAQLSTLNTRQTLNPTEVRLLAQTLTTEDIRKFSKFKTLAAAICDQQDVIEGWHRRYDDQVASAAAELDGS